MDQWRERGFVPDSDSESDDVEEYESLENKESERKEDTIEVPKVVITVGKKDNGGGRSGRPDDEEEGLRDNEEDGRQVVPQLSGHEPMDLLVEEPGNEEGVNSGADGEVLQGKSYDSQVVPQTFEPEPVDLEMEILEENENDGDGQETEPLHIQASEKPDVHISSGNDATCSQPADKTALNDRFWEPSSSPDELQFEEHITPKKPRPLTATDTPDGGQQPPEVESGSVSPLSSAVSVETPPSMDADQAQEAEGAQETSGLLPTEENIPSLSEIPEAIMETVTSRYGRDLRQRNPIQLHPYLLEDARYQTLLKTRGLRPERIINHDGAKPVGENQDQSFEENNPQSSPQNDPGDEFQFPPSSPAEPRYTLSNPAPKHPPQARKPDHARQPKVLTTPNRPSPRTDEHSSKRRKVTASYGRKDRTWISATPTQQQQTRPESPRVTTDPQGALAPSNILPSSPISEDITPPETQPPEGFRFPRDIYSTPLDPPVSEPRPTPRGNAATETVASSEHETEPHDDPIPISSSESESENPPEKEDLEVKRMRRQMRGVLPASWLRLDLKKHDSSAKAAQKRQASTPLGRDESAKGVAKRVMRTRGSNSPSRSQNWSSAIPISDESDTENGTPVVQERSREALADLMGFEIPVDEQKDMDDDIPEDNRIDGMFPPVSRRSRVSKPNKNVSGKERKHRNQERPVDTFPPSKRSKHMRQPDITKHVRGARGAGQRGPAKPKLPKLGILDAPDVVDRPRQEQPQFMRIATRQARSRRDRGRGSPSRKFLRLGTKVDTADANMSLYEWKAGTIRQNKTVKSASKPRQPLAEKRVNQPNRGKSRNENLARQRPGEGLGKIKIAKPRSPTEAQEISSNISIQGPPGRQEQSTVQVLSEKTHQPGRPVQVGSRWVVNRGLAISSLKRNATRPAQLEYTRPNNRAAQNSSAFKRSLETLNRAYNKPGLPEGYQLARFLADSTPQPAPPPEVRPKKPRRPRKHPPRRIDAEAVEHRQPEIIPVEDSPNSSIQLGEDIEVIALHGFSIGTPYTIDFDIAPLQFGTFFRQSTFIGSGEFYESLNVNSRDLDKEAGVAFIQSGQKLFKWGQWNETVSSELSLVIDSIIQEADGISRAPRGTFPAPSIASLSSYRPIIKWISNTLSFADPIDRLPFTEKCLAFNFKLIDQFSTQEFGTSTSVTQSQISYLRMGLFSLVFANQIRQISLHELIPSARLTEANDAVKNAAQTLLTCVFSKNGLVEIRRFLEENKLHEKRQVGVGEDHPYVEIYLAVQKVLSSDISFEECFEDFVTMGLLSTHSTHPETTSTIRALERLWHGVFTILPLDEIDEFGIFQVGSRFKQAHENWKLIKRLLSRVLGFYSTNPHNQSGSFNTYCRALFHRCFYLMNSWGWKNCKIILDTLFDFFAKNTLHHLRNEQSYGSPSFLENLDKSPSLEVEPRDCCFHIFLKIVGRGLQLMSGLYEKKRIRNIAWRLLPNHGRVYPKEKPLRQEDLDALKNHHDLLCTLYWKTPAGYRPKLEAIRDLVQPASSHGEACSISIRAWARLARFKLSTEEDISELEAFADWHSYFINEMLKQHSVARTEIEAQANLTSIFSRQVREKAITKNQRQIESILNSALTSLKDCIDAAKTMDQARVLLAKLPIVKLFGLFNSKTPRVNAVVYHSLDVILAFAHTDARVMAASTNIDVSEDSQDYGDWGAFEEIYEEQTEKPDETIDLLDGVIRPSVSRLVSNCFGEDQSPDDRLLLKVVDSWTSLIQVLVKHGRRFWSDYLNPYDGDSWASLRITAQTRKFTAHFLASLIEKSDNFYTECNTAILDLWISSLVERDTVLKFQHQLTNALLNADRENPLFQNLPFSMNRQNKRYEITLEEFRDRRLSLISSLLSNMQHSLAAQGRSNNSRREEYKSFVEKLMTGMKTNYKELGTTEDTTHRPYVDFVHRVIEFLQQYAQAICPIDTFFTNPTSFPLPATDPTYIVGKLKSYGLRLSTGKVSTQLIMFIQSVSERAAVDRQQIYLVDQLFTAMSDTFETGDYEQPTLRLFLLHCVFPTYVENAFYTPAAWILAKPILQSTGRVFRDLLLDIDINSEECLTATVDMVGVYLEAVNRALCKLVDKPTLLHESFALLTLPSILETITSVLPVVDYIERVSGRAKCIISYIKSFRQFSIFATNFLLGRIDPASTFEVDTATDMISVSPPSTSQLPKVFHDARDFASRELKNWLKDGLSFHGGKYYVRRGNQPKEISVTIPEDDGMAPLFTAIEVFFGTMERLDVFPRMKRGSSTESSPREHRRVLPGGDLLI